MVEVNSEMSEIEQKDAKRPESATSGEISNSLEAANIDQPSPARSPHARSWTVPGVYLPLRFTSILRISLRLTYCDYS